MTQSKERLRKLSLNKLDQLTLDLVSKWKFDEQQADPIHTTINPNDVVQELVRRLRQNLPLF